MNRTHELDHQLAELFGRYMRADGAERNRLGAQLDALAPRVLNKEKSNAEQPADRVAPPRCA